MPETLASGVAQALRTNSVLQVEADSEGKSFLVTIAPAAAERARRRPQALPRAMAVGEGLGPRAIEADAARQRTVGDPGDVAAAIGEHPVQRGLCPAREHRARAGRVGRVRERDDVEVEALRLDPPGQRPASPK